MKFFTSAALSAMLFMSSCDMVAAKRRRRGRRLQQQMAERNLAANNRLVVDGGNCMRDNYINDGHNQGLTCHAKEVYLKSVTSSSMECNEGDVITVSLTGTVHFNSARYDAGWYVSKDGGDAYNGQCSIGVFEESKVDQYTIINGDGNGVFRLSWTEDHFDGNDMCGDLMVQGGDKGADVVVPFMEGQMKCVDNDDDGLLDLAYCFSWSTAGNDSACSTQTTPPQVYPGNPAKCFCDIDNVPTIKVKKPPKPSILVKNKVYNCIDEGGSCAIMGEQHVEGDAKTDVTYCFQVTNTGTAELSNVVLEDPNLDNFSKNVGTLKPGETRFFYTEGKIPETGGASNTATVKGTYDGTEVSHSDTSAVSPTATTRRRHLGSGNNGLNAGDRTVVAGGNCIRDNYVSFEGNNQGITCSAKEVQFKSLSATQAECEEGTMYAIDKVEALVHFNTQRYDSGWYVSLDGGNAINGNCKLGVFNQQNVISLTPTSSAKYAVTFDNDHKDPGGDSCGDITTSDRESGNKGGVDVKFKLLENVEMLCQDTNGDGNLDFAMCFSWKQPGDPKDDVCSIDGAPAKLFPGTPAKCICQQYDIPAIAVKEAPVQIDDPQPLVCQAISHKGEVTVTNEVYLGTDGGASCTTDKPTNSVSGDLNAPVQFCFKVLNTGTTTLKNIKLTNEVLDYTLSPDWVLAPGESHLVSTPGTIAKDENNLLVVTADPYDKNGVYIETIGELTDNDDSAVKVFIPEPHPPAKVPHVTITNKVYVAESADDNGAQCGTPMAKDSASGEENTKVVYCFEVHNDGEVPLKDVEINNYELGIMAHAVGDLLLDGKAMVVYPGTITGDLKNIATVIGYGIDEAGNILDEVTDADDSMVEETTPAFVPAPAISLDNVVYAGDDEGKSCHTGAKEITVEKDSTVTYCLTVTNKGNTVLDSITLQNGVLEVDETLPTPLEPGTSTTLTYVKTATEDKTNSAIATGTPKDPEGNVTGERISATSGSGVLVTIPVDPVVYNPSIVIINKVYVGTETDNKCGTDMAGDLAECEEGSDVTYCFTVENTGDSHLDSVVIKDDVLGYEFPVSGVLAPGESRTLSLQKTLTTVTGTEPFPNTAVVVGNPVTHEGEDIPEEENVTHQDDSAVKVRPKETPPPANPSVKIDNVVYLGDDGGVSCHTGTERVEGATATAVTYCFTVTNTGNTYLETVTITNDDLGSFTQTLDGKLGPGDTSFVALPKTITGNLINKAVVVATPVTEAGDAIDGAPSTVTDEDTSGVGEVNPPPPAANLIPSVVIENKVYSGENDGQHCGTGKAKDTVEVDQFTMVTYCFEVKNNGETRLGFVELTNPKLEFVDNSITTLEVGQSVMVAYPASADIDLINTAIVKAKAIDELGELIPDKVPVQDDDTSSVSVVIVPVDPVTPPAPAVDIKNTVYLGTDGGASCGTDKAVEKVEGIEDTAITYCFKVTNTGNTHLSSLMLTDPDLNYEFPSTKTLAPGDFEYFFLPSTITADLVNTVKVVANPVTETGDDIVDVDDVSATDPSEVGIIIQDQPVVLIPSINIENTVYLGDDGGDSCGTDMAKEHAVGSIGSIVTYCFTVKNSGETALNEVYIEDPALSFTDDTIGFLGVGQSAVVAYTATIDSALDNIATVTGKPVDESLNPIDGVPDTVTDNDPSSVGMLEINAEINIENTVYIGSDLGESCSTAVEKVTAAPATGVVYCFLVTNTGDSNLNSVTVTNPKLGDYVDNSIGSLAPGQSKLLALPSTIEADLVNLATVTGQPAGADFSDILSASPVTDNDTSEVALLAPPTSDDDCMEEEWIKQEKTDDLVCATKDVYISSVSAEEAKTCSLGEMVTLTIDATVVFEEGAASAKDVGWYIATDGGDAMTGTCVVNGFQQGNDYNVVDGDGAAAGSVNWDDGDQCGDMVLSGTSGEVSMPVAVAVTMPCKDENEDGDVDFAICFAWNTGPDGACTFDTMIPGAGMGMCYCTRVDIPNVKVADGDLPSDVC